MLEERFYDLKASVVLQKVSPECFRAFDVEEGDAFELNEVSFRILSLLAEGRSLSQVMGFLLEEYDVDPDTLRTDVETLVQEAIDAGLLVART